MDVQSGDTSKVSVGDGLEEASQALGVIEVEDSCTVEDWTSFSIDRSAGEQKTVEGGLPDDTFDGPRLLAGNAIVRDASGLHSLAADIFRCLFGGLDDSERLDGLGTIGLTVLSDSIEKRASLLIRPSIVLVDGDETLVEEVAINLVANLDWKTENAWEWIHGIALLLGVFGKLRYGVGSRGIPEQVVEWESVKMGMPLPCLLRGGVMAHDGLLGL
jgi:hypothetical protein